MTSSYHIVLDWSDWLNMFHHFFMMSMLSVGGAVSTLPEMHRFLVEQHHWISEAQFNASVAIGQASPGPNILFVVLLGWNVGINAGSVLAGFMAVLIAMTGMLIPSTTLAYLASGWLASNNQRIAVRAFKLGLAPIVIALLVASGWILASGHPDTEWRLWLMTLVSTLVVWKTRINLLWILGAGALLGWFGVI